jgi:carboxymethylenebutenolidase
MEIKQTEFTASDGHRFSACCCEPQEDRKGVVIVIQEIFGLTEHMCSLTQRFAEKGYLSIAPALFDRVAENSVLPYSESGAERGKELVSQLDNDKVLLDLQAIIDAHTGDSKIGIVGYCWGGSIAYLAASCLKLDAGIAYYGTRIHQMLQHKPACPFMFHFGEQDKLVPMENINMIRSANPNLPLHLYPNAGHAFSCEPRPSYHPVSAEIAMDRSLAFLDEYLGV